MFTTKQPISINRKNRPWSQWLLLFVIVLGLGSYHQTAKAHLFNGIDNPLGSSSNVTDNSPPPFVGLPLTEATVIIEDAVPFSFSYDFTSTNSFDSFEFKISHQAGLTFDLNKLQLLFVKDSLTTSSPLVGGSNTSFIGTGSPALLAENSSYGAGWYQKVYDFSGWDHGTLLNINFDWTGFHDVGDPDDSFTIHIGVNENLVATPTTSHVPIPATAWLLGSGLFGLFGFSRRRLPTGS